MNLHIIKKNAAKVWHELSTVKGHLGLQELVIATCLSKKDLMEALEWLTNEGIIKNEKVQEDEPVKYYTDLIYYIG